MFRSQRFHTLQFLIIFLLLVFFFLGYVGIITPGGKGYSPFLEQHLNFPAWLTYIISQFAKGLLQLCGYDVYQKAPNNVTIHGSRGVTIIWACLGFGVMSYWVAFVSAHRVNWKYKLKWMAVGIGVINGINVLRIASIALANHYHWQAFKLVEPHFAFNIISYIAIFGLTLWFAYRYKQYVINKKTAGGNRAPERAKSINQG